MRRGRGNLQTASEIKCVPGCTRRELALRAEGEEEARLLRRVERGAQRELRLSAPRGSGTGTLFSDIEIHQHQDGQILRQV